MGRKKIAEDIVGLLTVKNSRLNAVGREVYKRLNSIELDYPMERICPECGGRYGILDTKTHPCLINSVQEEDFPSLDFLDVLQG